jgi:GNAT superfamily N-acetyltransferase
VAGSILECRFSKIKPLRAVFLQELNAQVRYDAAHTRQGTTHYVIRYDGRDIGYGAVKDTHQSGGTAFEFYLLPPYRSNALDLLRGVIDVSGAEALECQTNDAFYTALVRQFCNDLTSDTVLFAAGQSNHLTSLDGVFRRRQRRDRVFEHHAEPVGDFVVDVRGEIFATGGFLLHYNPPFADLFMEVREDVRRRGHGSFLIQGLITECYLAGRVPAARTGVDNIASQRTLLKGGLRECGRVLRAVVARARFPPTPGS